MSTNNYIVSARKYRPATFRSVVGQESLTHTLKTAIASQRLAHAYLFCGPRGVGKTTCARIFAKTINCLSPTAEGEACNECELCRAFNEQRSYNITELDAASNNSVDDIRNINEQVRIPPQTGMYRVFIIDEVHMLTTAAFNAFLKTLEEPPEYAIFILATTEKQKVLPTILSRCQIYDFSRITVPDIVKQLQYICEEENVEAEPAALNVIAQKADGAMRDALSIFDQVTASSEGHITYRSAIENLNVLDYDYYFKLVEAFIAGDVPQALLIYRDIREKGFDSQFFVNGLGQHVRDLMVSSTPQTHSLLEMNAEVAQLYVTQAAKVTPRFLYQAIELCNTTDLNYRNASNKQLLVELMLIKLSQIMNPMPQEQPVQQAPKVQKIATPAPQAAPRQAAPAPQVPQAPPQPVAPAPQPLAAQPAAPMRPTPPPPAPAPPRQASAPSVPRPAATPRILVNTTAQPKRQAEQPVAASTNVAPSHEVRRAAFTPEQLQQAWNAYINNHPNEHVVINTMRMASPQRVTDTQYMIEVQNPSQVQFIQTAMNNLLTELRNAVSNDMLALDIKITDRGPAPKIWTQREIAEEIVKNNPKFAQFIKDYELSLA
ncbi:MAG: DNA polymerase III subunit gamma/tau [Bacteroidales bacterium]|nr:DNA polymerase III subunit gamma/tau [Candidatus Sodaliphilus fimicaballi]